MPGPVNLRQAGPAAGPKARVLGQLLQAGFRVPEGFAVVQEDSLEPVVQAWPVAVRSSSALEDGQVQSFAGQFLTVLNVQDEESLRTAVARVRESLPTGGSVIVQQMVAARVAGVFFTVDPTAPGCARIEAAPGLGDALVSGHVRPTSWRIHSDGRQELVEGAACLQESEIASLLDAARRAQQLLGGELDLEFAFDQESHPWILQARPITASQDRRERLRVAEIARVQSLSHPGGTVWSRYSLAESLPAPLPMTWSVVRRMMSGQGAYGRLYRDLGYEPHASLGEQGSLDLICGRPYYNLSREVKFYYGDFPFVHSIEAIRSDPRRASYPSPRMDLRVAPPGFWWKLPGYLWKMFRSQLQIERLCKTFGARLENEIAPPFVTRVADLRGESLANLSAADLRQRLQMLIALVVDDFAAESLKASALAAFATGELERKHGAEATRRMLAGVRPRPEADRCADHRGPLEMELAEPRWFEIPERRPAQIEPPPPERGTWSAEVVRARDWVALRETARHWLMLGWAELRRTLLALDERLALGGGIFWLELHELESFQPARIAERQQQRRVFLSMPCPPVLFSDDLQAIGRAPSVTVSGDALRGTGLSWGSIEGTALVVQEASQVPAEARDFVLVCPTTDPGYTFAMNRSVALVVETGGVLSHGAIIARELGLPAVANVEIGQLKSGMRLRVDGEAGVVEILA